MADQVSDVGEVTSEEIQDGERPEKAETSEPSEDPTASCPAVGSEDLPELRTLLLSGVSQRIPSQSLDHAGPSTCCEGPAQYSSARYFRGLYHFHTVNGTSPGSRSAQMTDDDTPESQGSQETQTCEADGKEEMDSGGSLADPMDIANTVLLLPQIQPSEPSYEEGMWSHLSSLFLDFHARIWFGEEEFDRSPLNENLRAITRYAIVDIVVLVSWIIVEFSMHRQKLTELTYHSSIYTVMLAASAAMIILNFFHVVNRLFASYGSGPTGIRHLVNPIELRERLEAVVNNLCDFKTEHRWKILYLHYLSKISDPRYKPSEIDYKFSSQTEFSTINTILDHLKAAAEVTDSPSVAPDDGDGEHSQQIDHQPFSVLHHLLAYRDSATSSVAEEYLEPTQLNESESFDSWIQKVLECINVVTYPVETEEREQTFVYTKRPSKKQAVGKTTAGMSEKSTTPIDLPGSSKQHSDPLPPVTTQGKGKMSLSLKFRYTKRSSPEKRSTAPVKAAGSEVAASHSLSGEPQHSGGRIKLGKRRTSVLSRDSEKHSPKAAHALPKRSKVEGSEGGEPQGQPSGPQVKVSNGQQPHCSQASAAPQESSPSRSRELGSIHSHLESLLWEEPGIIKTCSMFIVPMSGETEHVFHRTNDDCGCDLKVSDDVSLPPEMELLKKMLNLVSDLSSRIKRAMCLNLRKGEGENFIKEIMVMKEALKQCFHILKSASRIETPQNAPFRQSRSLAYRETNLLLRRLMQTVPLALLQTTEYEDEDSS